MKPEVFAIYFPHYHSHHHNDAWYGEGWTEWELVRQAPPRFEGHHQPLRPAWGFFDESDPVWAEREIALASGHGITGFLVDWYWYSGVQIMQSQLEQGFLTAANREQMKFALMWANHPWMDVFPVACGRPSPPTWLPLRHTPRDMQMVAEYCVAHYFRQPNYWKVGGRPYFSFFSLALLERTLGGESGVASALRIFDDVVRNAGFPGMHFGLNIANVDVSVLCWDEGMIGRAKRMGFHSVFGYNIARSPRHREVRLENPLVDYRDVVEAHGLLWNRCVGRGLPFIPTATVGYDCSPRWDRSVRFPLETLDYPYEPIVINNTPEAFGGLCQSAQEFLAAHPETPAVFLNAWNEWTEGNYLLPEARYGDAYLKAVKAAFGS